MSNRKLDEVYYIDQDIEHLRQKRERLTRDEITKKEMLELFEKWSEEELPILHKPKLSEGSIKLYIGHVKQFLDSLPDNTEVTRKEVLTYSEKVIKNNAATTTENKFVAISKFLVYCRLYDLKLQKPKTQSKTAIDNVISDDQYKRLLRTSKSLIKSEPEKAHIWEEMYLTLRTLGMCGIRIEERQFITYENLHKGAIVEVYFKGKFKPIFINEKVRQELLEYANHNKLYEGSLFKLNDSQVRYRIDSIVKKSGIRKGKFNPHAFRHYFAIKFMDQVGNIQILRQILGHSAFETTAIYLQQTNANIKDLINTMDFSESTTMVAKTDTGKLISDYEELVYGHRGQWTKKAAVKLLIDLLNTK